MVLNYDAYVSIFMVVIILISLGVIIRVACKSKKEETTSATRTMTHQTEHASDVLSHLDFLDYSQQQEQNVYSISGRVQGQEQQQRFPEAFVSVEHISIMNEMNKPPKYDDAPPSYEEAIKIAMAQNNSMETLRAEQAGVHQASSSSSVTVVQPAVPNRTTE
ncbi:uncharacterized protein LOC115884078 isoform X2 [Sitophilus oryzae]|uniref:Uncharacterized protein LOC115884078 isoform X2 n=1 Tax=Sitophilus oryzae TaxID=7048 RepID=A0A6J2Y573_SITOR|nr:uncharacterized protein LOC115884078 isoform X2 [Sitophilus oryzae]